ncbi:MAG: protein-L-isoaspartate O-methyltransferase [Betaproteobacteria bacterium]|nr:protein-L-isoaspartate O-methyltransferase [Betaproteobacteria bacterium]
MGNDRARMRANMIEQQIRPWDVPDEAVLDLYRTIPREDFVPAPLRDLAYADSALPIGFGQTMLEPKLEARMVQALALSPHDAVLHVGCGSGFFAALLGSLAGAVETVEIIPELAAAAAKRLGKFRNITVVSGDGARGVAGKKFDAVVLTGATPIIAPEFWQNLNDGGRLLAVMGRAPAMTLSLVEKRKKGMLLRRDILETCIPLLQNAPAMPAFEF